MWCWMLAEMAKERSTINIGGDARGKGGGGGILRTRCVDVCRCIRVECAFSQYFIRVYYCEFRFVENRRCSLTVLFCVSPSLVTQRNVIQV